MKRIGLPLLGLFLALNLHAQDLPTQLNGKLVALRGKSALPFAAPDLPKAKYIALYFSAGWCGPCRQFTPDLVKFYNETRPSHPEFEIVFLSQDEGASAMEKYMSETAMPWPALRYSAVKGSPLAKHAGSGIPNLVLLDAKGEVLSLSYVSGNYVGPRKVMRDLQKFLSGDGSGVANSDLASAAPVAATAATPTGNSIKSPSGTNWDEAFKKKP